jgi:hypothetical protein
MRPGKKGEKKMKMETRNVRFERETLERVRRRAEAEGVKESEVIRRAVEAFVAESEGEELGATLEELYVIKALTMQLMRQAVGDGKAVEIREEIIRAAKAKAAAEARRLRKG